MMPKFVPFFFFVVVTCSSAADIVLSPSGPVSSPQAALAAARAAQKPVRILVSDGVYPITKALSLGAEDSGVTWEAAADAKPSAGDASGSRELAIPSISAMPVSATQA